MAAGTFYPGRADELAAMVDSMLAGAKAVGGSHGSDQAPPVALVAPHAGYAFSGPVAASAYALLRGSDIHRAAILGPAHFVPLRGCAVPATDVWRTPLGQVGIDRELRNTLEGPGVAVDEAPHEPEHSIEVQLPFLQRVLGAGLTVLPVAVGASEPGEIATMIEALADDAVIIVSTDLSHYHDHATARQLDRRTADAVLAREPGSIGPEDACGVFALRGLVELARRRRLQTELLDLRTSAETAGDPLRVVGYGAFALRGG